MTTRVESFQRNQLKKRKKNRRRHVGGITISSLLDSARDHSIEESKTQDEDTTDADLRMSSTIADLQSQQQVQSQNESLFIGPFKEKSYNLSLSRSTSFPNLSTPHGTPQRGVNSNLPLSPPLNIFDNLSPLSQQRKAVDRLSLSFSKETGSDEALLRTTFHAWRNFTRMKVVSKLRKSLAERERKNRMNETKIQIRDYSFLALASLGVITIFAAVLLYNYWMIAPYLTPIMLAFLLGLPLGIIKDYMILWLNSLEIRLHVFAARQNMTRVVVSILLLCIFVIAQLLFVAVVVYLPAPFIGLVVFLMPAFNFIFLSFTFSSQREYLITTFLVFALFAIITFPMYFWVQNCLYESTEATNRIVNYISHHHELQNLVTNYENSTIFLRLSQYAESWGYNVTALLKSEAVKEKLISLVSSISSNINVFFQGAIGIVSDLGNFLFATVIFMSALFYIVQHNTLLWTELAELSPFTIDEQKKIYDSLKQCVSRIFLCSVAVGSLHFMVTYISFSIAEIDLKNIFAAISAFLATVPFLGTWLLWLPVSVYLFFCEQYFSFAVVLSTHFVATYYLQPLIFSWIPGNPYYVSMSAVLGISSFGVVGSVYGPLLAGILVTLFDIIKTYYSADRAANDQRRQIQNKQLQQYTQGKKLNFSTL